MRYPAGRKWALARVLPAVVGLLLVCAPAWAGQTANVTVGNAAVSCDFAGTLTAGVGYEDAVNNPSSCANPAITNIILGDTVKWTWGSSGQTHSVGTTSFVAFPGCSDSATTGNTCSMTPSSPGSISYECDVHGSYMTGTINVAAFGAANHFSVSPSTGTPTAGTQFTVTVTALDRNNNVVTNYSTALSFSSSDGSATFSLNTNWNNGVLIENVTLHKSQSQTVTASNGDGSGSGGVTVQPAAAIDHFGITAPPTATQGSSTNVTVTAFDVFNNVKTDYSGMVRFISSDGTATVNGASLPASFSLPGGSGVFGVTFNTTGTQSISVNDTATTSATGTTNLTVNSASCPVSDKTFSNNAKITVTSTQASSTIPVSGFASNQVVGKITVTLNGFDTTCQADAAFLLVGPGGQNFALESLIGNCDGTSHTVTLTLDDAASSNLQEYICDSSCGLHAPQASGSFRPSSYANADPQCTGCTVPLTFTAPAPTSGYNAPTTDGSATLASAFGGTSPNGTWTLYGLSQYGGTTTTLDGGWSITITPGYEQDNGATIMIPAGAPTQTMGPASPYPSTVNFSGLPGNIAQMQLIINGFNHTFPNDVSVMLVGPKGQAIELLSDVGNGSQSQSNLSNLVIDDSAPSLVPQVSPLPSGFFKPTDYFTRILPQNAPQSLFGQPAPVGTATLSTGPSAVFAGTDPNGPWSLYVYDGAGGDFGSFANGWGLRFELQCATCNASVAASTGTSSSFNQSVTFTATLTSNFEVSPRSGTVTFCDGAASGGTCTGTTLGTGSVDGTGHATFTTSALAVGLHSISANFPGDSTYPAATSAPIAFTVSTGPTATFVGSSLNPSTFGQSVTFTANVVATPFGGSPTGTVTFKDGGVTIGSAPLSGGTATFATSALTASASPHSITVVYSGDGNFSTSTSSTLTQTVNKANSATALGSSLNPSTYGTNVTFTATVTSTAGTPTGTVTFKDGATVLGTPTLSAGKATFSSSTLAVGGHSITASYSGAGDYNTSASSTLTQTVNQQTTTTSVISSKPAGALYGQSITFTASVSASPTGPSVPACPGGTPNCVTFKDGATVLGTAPLSSQVASITCAPGNPCGPISATPTSHSITAVYGGDGNYNGSTSSTLTQTVNKTGTTATIGSSVNPSSFGQSVTLTATLTSQVSSVSADGTVTFCDGAVTSGACTGTTLATPSLSGGVATLATATLATGTHTINALYGGSNNFKSSDSTGAPLMQTVTKAATTTTLTVKVTPAYLPGTQDLFRHQITLTATVTSGVGTPGCSVTFMDNGVALAPAQALAAGKASITVVLGTIGLHPITAVYGGCSNFNASTSAVLDEYRTPKPH